MKWFTIFCLGLIGLLSPGAVAQEGNEAPAPVSRDAIDSAIGRGVDFLVKDQDMDGSWRFDTRTHRAGVTGLCVYTLLKGGLSRNHQAVQRGLAFLDVCEATTTYQAACMILAYGEADANRYRARLQKLTDSLVEWSDGTWAYPYGAKDLSNTHFGTMGLHHARRLGLKIPEKLWKRIARAILRQQLDGGGFAYNSGNQPTLSMGAAGIGVACMVREALQSLGSGYRSELKDLDAAIGAGLGWFDANYNLHEEPWLGNVDGRRWDFYFLYALQRVGLLAPARTIAGHDWYQDGARWLLKNQKDTGQWGTPYGEKQPNTCLAILFLRRVSGPSTGSKSLAKRVFRTEDPDADMTLVVAGESPMRVWIESFDELILDSFEWPEEEGKGLRIAGVQYWSGEQLLAEVAGDGSGPAGNKQFMAELAFDGPGAYGIVAVVKVVPPPGEMEGHMELRTMVLPIEVSVGMLPWMRDAIDDHSRNLLRDTRVRCSTSSDLNGHWAGLGAVDGLMGRGWVCEATDAEPWITLDLSDAQRGNVLVFSHASEAGNDNNAFARAGILEVQINKKKWVRVEMDLDEHRKTRLVLSRVQKVRRIKVRLLEMTPGLRHGKAGGLMEVELHSVKGAR